MRNFFIAVVLALPAAGARAVELDGMDEVSDPEILSEMKKADESNLDNAMSRGRADAQRGASYVRALMAGARFEIEGLIADIGAAPPSPGAGVPSPGAGVPSPGAGEDAEELTLAYQMLGVKADDFSKKARKAELEFPAAKPEALLSQRLSYPAKDRKRDLKRAQTYLQKAKKRLAKKGGGELNAEQVEVLSAVGNFISELSSALRAGTQMSLRFKKTPKAGSPPSEAGVPSPEQGSPAGLARIEARLEQTRRDIAALGVEKQLLEVSFALSRHEDDLFEQGE